MKTGLFIGRFQPLHKGHLLIMAQCARKVERLIIGLGSVNVAQSCKNPFTAQERAEMIMRGMKELGVASYEVVELPDVSSDAEWIKMVVKTVGKFDIAWSGDKHVVSIFEKAGLPIQMIKKFAGLSGTKIRRNMASGRPWLKFVPLSTRKYLHEIKAAQRVRELCK